MIIFQQKEGTHMKKNLIVGQSGGPTAVINGSLYGVVTEAMRHTEEIDEIYGMINGIEGFLNGHMMDMRSLIDQIFQIFSRAGQHLMTKGISSNITGQFADKGSIFVMNSFRDAYN